LEAPRSPQITHLQQITSLAVALSTDGWATHSPQAEFSSATFSAVPAWHGVFGFARLNRPDGTLAVIETPHLSPEC
jgi:hypothetical protein